LTAGKVLKAEFIRSAHGAGDLLRDGRPEVAFVGRSNVGKSSLMNRLLGKKGLARTSSTPGRTRAVNYFLIDARWYCVDLPGYGYARAGKDERRAWGELVDHYLRQAKAWVVMLVDAKVGATRLDVEAFRYLRSLGAGISVVATKIDQLSRGKRAPALAGIRETLELAEDVPLLAASAVTGEGMKELWNEVAERLAALQVD
jgi:GTP-binding protein